MRKIKGVSPIISVLLLIVIAVAAAVVTYGFVMGFIGGTTTTTTPAQSVIKVDAVNMTGSKNNVPGIFIRNVGTTTVTVDAIYIYDVNGTLVKANTTLEVTINPGTVWWVNTSLSLPNGTYYVKVTTEEGAVVTSEIFTVD